jgi:hypothetical protein
MARRDWELVPEAQDQATAMEELIVRRAAEETGGLGHAPERVGGELISSLPESPAATHAAQRHCRTGRHAVRSIWQTGQRWIYRRLRDTLL